MLSIASTQANITAIRKKYPSLYPIAQYPSKNPLKTDASLNKNVHLYLQQL